MKKVQSTLVRPEVQMVRWNIALNRPERSGDRYSSFATKRKFEFVKKSARAENGIEKSVPFFI